ncbi:hypothetical protein [Paenibacillus sp. SI8]|uniref:hypothetical protein n=1 Tax=unclassified Paenibacillus TaxID=185978 RepID=UPI003466D7AA
MSRKWERMVSKNAKKANKTRLKQGIPPVSDPNPSQVFKGRSTIFSLFFVAVSIFLLFSTRTVDGDNMYWFTTLSYFAVGVLFYFARRPYLKVSKTTLSKRGFAKELHLTPDAIKQIIRTKGSVIIELNNKSRWVYAKVINRFDVAAMADKLKSFAEQHNIAFVDQSV